MNPAWGVMRHRDREMFREEIEAFVKSQQIAHVANFDPDGWPYVMPLVYIYEEGVFYLHTGAHKGQFLRNVRADSRICLEISAIGPLPPGKPSACNSTAVYTSVIAFGRLEIYQNREQKRRFLDRLLEKHAPDATFEPGYPAIGCILLYSFRPEILTGKR
ncbi:MAG: pyridoxamine 5'-phosphate oxidase family protein, partial [Calditrichaeota bacterium]